MAYKTLIFFYSTFLISMQAKTLVKNVVDHAAAQSTSLESFIGSESDTKSHGTKRVEFNSSTGSIFRIIQVPKRYFDKSLFVVEVVCWNASVFATEIVVSTPSQPKALAFRRIVPCPRRSQDVHTVRLKLPRYIVYRPSHVNRYSVYVEFATLRWWMLERKTYDSLTSRSSPDYYAASSLKFESDLKIAEPYDRPVAPATKCHDWLGELLLLLSSRPYAPKCDQESEVVRAVTFPVVLSGFAHGIHRTYAPYKNANLRFLQLQALRKPKFSFAIWLYVEDYCPFQRPYCSILKHITWDDRYATPQISIDRNGRVGVELIMERGSSVFQLSAENEVVPRYTWCLFLLSCQPHGCNFSLSHGSPLEIKWMRTIAIAKGQVLYLDDTLGLMVYGGSELSSSFKGYIGKATFYRRKAIRPDEAEMLTAEDAAVKLQLNQKHSRCTAYTRKIHRILERRRCLIRKALGKVTCPSKDRDPFRSGNDVCAPTDDEECRRLPSDDFSPVHQYVRTVLWQYAYRGWLDAYADVAAEIYAFAEDLLETEGAGGMQLVISLLKQSSCLGNHDASFMLSVVLNYGLTVKSVEIEPHSYLMYGASEGNRLCLLSLGNKHVYGLDGFTQDYEQAYVYFKPVAELTGKALRVHDRNDVYTEMVRLTNDVEVKEQTVEDGDVTQFLRMRAEQGALLAQKRLARMYYWGSGGLTRNIETAFKYYKMAADSGDPSSLYDYGIVLLKGHGTEKNLDLAIEVLEKSADLGYAQALNTLGWIAMELEKNFTKAADLFHRSHDMGNKDASFNLAHMFLKGKYPNSTVDRVRAWEYIAAGALRGQYEAGILVGKYNIRGHPSIRRNPEVAVGWTRYVAERNPAIGRLLHKGLKSYKDKNWFLALVYYFMSASTGVEVANFNLAYLCDEDQGGFVKLLDKECKWRHYNLSIQRAPKDVDPYAWNKMAHYHYYHGLNGRQDKQEAVRLYFNAAIKGDPQGLYNLAMLVEEDVSISEYFLNSLLVPSDVQSDKFYLMAHLLTRCQESKRAEAYLPCTFALYELLLKQFWIVVNAHLGIAVALSMVLFTLIVGLLFLRRSSN